MYERKTNSWARIDGLKTHYRAKNIDKNSKSKCDSSVTFCLHWTFCSAPKADEARRGRVSGDLQIAVEDHSSCHVRVHGAPLENTIYDSALKYFRGTYFHRKQQPYEIDKYQKIWNNASWIRTILHKVIRRGHNNHSVRTMASFVTTSQ